MPIQLLEDPANCFLSLCVNLKFWDFKIVNIASTDFPQKV